MHRRISRRTFIETAAAGTAAMGLSPLPFARQSPANMAIANWTAPEDSDEAIAHGLQVLRISPNDAGAQSNLGFLYANSGRPADAVRHFEQALRLDPRDKAAHDGLREARAMMGEAGE